MSQTHPGTGSNAANFRELFREHARFAWRVLRRFGVAEGDLDDACQEVFVVVHRQLASFEGRSSVRTWIYEIARRTALAQRRKGVRHAHAEYDERSGAGDEVARSPAQQVADTRALAWLERALSELDDDKREAFVLYELEDMTLAEIAEALGAPINTVHYRIQTARAALRGKAERSGVVGPTPGGRRIQQGDAP